MFVQRQGLIANFWRDSSCKFNIYGFASMTYDEKHNPSLIK